MALVRASSLDLFLACNGAWNLQYAPVSDDYLEKRKNEGAEWGTMVHTWKQTGKIEHRSKRTAASFKKRVAGVSRLDYWDYRGWHEVGVAYNWYYGYAVTN